MSQRFSLLGKYYFRLKLSVAKGIAQHNVTPMSMNNPPYFIFQIRFKPRAPNHIHTVSILHDSIHPTDHRQPNQSTSLCYNWSSQTGICAPIYQNYHTKTIPNENIQFHLHKNSHRYNHFQHILLPLSRWKGKKKMHNYIKISTLKRCYFQHLSQGYIMQNHHIPILKQSYETTKKGTLNIPRYPNQTL